MTGRRPLAARRTRVPSANGAPLRVGIVGAGRMGGRRAEAVRAAPDAELVGIADIHAGKARSMARMHGTKAFVSPEALLRTSAIDLVLVCTPNRAHEPVVVSALEAGKDVFCEKPLAGDHAAAKRMLRSAERAGRSLAVGANTRWIPSVRAALETARSQVLGRGLLFRGWIGHDGSRLNGPWYTRRAQAGGGTLLDNGVHLLDLARTMLGDFTGCFARVGRLAHPEWEVEDVASVIYDVAGGRLASVTSSWIDRSGYFYFELHGEHGYLTVDSDGGMRVARSGSAPGPSTPLDPGPPGESYRQEVAHLVHRLRSGQPPEPDGADGAYLVRSVEAAYASSKLGRYVSIP